MDARYRDSDGRAGHTRAVVLGGHYGALSVARALGGQGLGVAVVATDRDDHACHSRFVSEVVVAPDPAEDSDGLLKVLMGSDEAWSGALLVPTLDEYVTWVSQNRAELGRKFVFAVQGWDVIEPIVSKNLLYATARGLGVPMPDFLVPDSVSSLDAWRDERHYPCILKPYESRRFSEIYGTKVLIARDHEELVRKYADTQDHMLDVMVCEIIPGEDSSIFTYHSYIDSRGEVLAEICTQKLRQYPSGFGQGSVVRTVPMIAEIRAHALALLRASGYRGESSTEFRLDSRDGRYKLMEINTRPIVYERLLVEAGVNLPHITYRDLVEDVRQAPEAYETDLHWIHNHWEFVNLVRLVKSGHLGLGRFLQPYGKKRVYAVPFFDDPVHFLREIGHNGALALRRIRERRAL